MAWSKDSRLCATCASASEEVYVWTFGGATAQRAAGGADGGGADGGGADGGGADGGGADGGGADGGGADGGGAAGGGASDRAAKRVRRLPATVASPAGRAPRTLRLGRGRRAVAVAFQPPPSKVHEPALHEPALHEAAQRATNERHGEERLLACAGDDGGLYLFDVSGSCSDALVRWVPSIESDGEHGRRGAPLRHLHWLSADILVASGEESVFCCRMTSLPSSLHPVEVG